MKIPGKLLLQTLQDGDVYFFDKKATVGIPDHRHICVKKTGDTNIIFACCTSNQDTMNRFLEKKNLPSSSIVYINNAKYPFLTKDTYINCNNVSVISENQFVSECDNGLIEKKGKIDLSDYAQIVTGIKESILVEEEIKDLIPDVQ